MKPFRRLAEATTPDGSVLALFEHDGSCVIRVNGVELMSARRHHSEDALAALACAPLSAQPHACVLIGGLGLGFTLRAALGILAPGAHVVVAEIIGAVIDWNRNPDYPLASDALRDPRVEICHADVADVLAQRPGAFDAIMLDVDNGPDPLTTAGNARLYQADGIRLAVAALRPGGRLAYWSADDDRAFPGTLRSAGLSVTASSVRAHSTTGPKHTVYIAQRASERRQP
jgi:spermidine synthase